MSRTELSMIKRISANKVYYVLWFLTSCQLPVLDDFINWMYVWFNFLQILNTKGKI